MNKKIKADLALVLVTVFWGSTFIISKMTLVSVDVFLFLFLRLSIAALILFIFVINRLHLITISLLKHSVILAIFLYTSYFFQMYGIQFTTASNAGFITGLSVVLVPVFNYLFFREKTNPVTIISVFIAFAGLFLLTGANPLQWNKGDFWVFLCAITVAFHIIYTGKFAKLNPVLLLTAFQLGFVSLFSALPLIWYNPATPFTIPAVTEIYAILYLALFGTVFTYVTQTSMQRFTSSAHTALIFSLEPFFAALFAWLIANEKLDTIAWIGGSMIIIAMVLAETGQPLMNKFKNYIMKKPLRFFP